MGGKGRDAVQLYMQHIVTWFAHIDKRDNSEGYRVINVKIKVWEEHTKLISRNADVDSGGADTCSWW